MNEEIERQIAVVSKLVDTWEWECSVHGPARFAQDLAITPYESLDSWTAEHFAQDAALVTEFLLLYHRVLSAEVYHE